jgi:hypothetical protein
MSIRMYTTDFDDLSRPHANCYWVIPGRFLAGEYPGAYHTTTARERLIHYLAAGVTTFIDLTHPNDGLTPYADILTALAAEQGIDVTYQRYPIYDMSVPTQPQMVTILDAIDHALTTDAGVYVHCWGGIGRTGAVVGCHLVRHGLDGEAALAQIAQWWQTVEKSVRSPRSPETQEQAAMVRGWRE